MFNINDFNDPVVWDLMCSGRTKGVFQLESNLGSSWSKSAKPRSIEDLAALISIMRPGVLKAMLDGKSMAKHYVDRKAGIEPVVYLHPSLEPILKGTYGIIVYQEQSMKIAQLIAGFNLEEADDLRKAIGKKKADLMAKVKIKFIEGCKKIGIVSDEVAIQIFDNIEKSNRYAFNKSHAISYAINAYWSAYCKVYKPVKFYKVWLEHAWHKLKPHEEVSELVGDAKLVDIEVYPPRLNHFHLNFYSINKKIYYGISSIKDVGDTQCKKLFERIPEAEKELNKKLEDFTWLDILLTLVPTINKRVVSALIAVGAFSGKQNKTSRKTMEYEFSNWESFSEREQEWMINNYKDLKITNLHSLVLEMINKFKIQSTRLKKVCDISNLLQNPVYDLEDYPEGIAQAEEKYMGVALTCTKSDSVPNDLVNCTCKQIVLGEIAPKTKVNLAVKIKSVREWKTKGGKTPGKLMAFLSMEDSSANMDSAVIFSEAFAEYRNLLRGGNTVLVLGEVSDKKDGVIVNKVVQL